MCAIPVSNGSESPERHNLVITGIAGVALAVALLALLLFVAFRGRSKLHAHLESCDAMYREKLAKHESLQNVRECYAENFRLQPWDRNIAFRIQSAADLDAERKSPQGGPLTELANGDLTACDRIESDIRLNEKTLRTRWLDLCLILTR